MYPSLKSNIYISRQRYDCVKSTVDHSHFTFHILARALIAYIIVSAAWYLTMVVKQYIDLHSGSYSIMPKF